MSLIEQLPKTELHVHIEGTLTPELMFDLAASNKVELPYANVAEVREAYQFDSLQPFLDVYYKGASVLQQPEDYYRLMSDYLTKASADGVRHAEIFFDPQTHTERGIGFPVFMKGFKDAIRDEKAKSGMSADLIMSFLRHLPGEAAVETIREAEDHLDGVVAVGLDSSERGRPPELFVEAFEIAHKLGLRATAHAMEEGPPSYGWSALDNLGVERIDHGVGCMEDPELVKRLADEQIPLTVCPQSNVRLKVVKNIKDHPLPAMIKAGLLVSINSDDPTYFGGFIGDNYRLVEEAFGYNKYDLANLAAMSIQSSFLSEDRKQALLEEIAPVLAAN